MRYFAVLTEALPFPSACQNVALVSAGHGSAAPRVPVLIRAVSADVHPKLGESQCWSLRRLAQAARLLHLHRMNIIPASEGTGYSVNSISLQKKKKIATYRDDPLARPHLSRPHRRRVKTPSFRHDVDAKCEGTTPVGDPLACAFHSVNLQTLAERPPRRAPFCPGTETTAPKRDRALGAAPPARRRRGGRGGTVPSNEPWEAATSTRPAAGEAAG